MMNYDKRSLVISIENSIDFIKSHLDSADKTVAFVLTKHGIKDLESASIHTLYDIFDELYAIEADLK